MNGTLVASMLDSMEEKQERTRLIFDCPELHRRAVRFWMARHGVDSVSEAIVAAIEGFMIREMGEAEEAISSGEPAPTPKRGRKPKKE